MYVREQKAIALEDAIRKMTSLAAAQVKIRDRGIIRPAMMADITVFDMNRIEDKATYVDPMHYSLGIVHVLVNGKAVVRDGKITDERPGRPLRGPGYRPRPSAN
jgi:N-acyl-D-amino-acid deacylase